MDWGKGGEEGGIRWGEDGVREYWERQLELGEKAHFGGEVGI